MSKFFYTEMKSLVCGDLLGEGSARKVYVLKVDRTRVIKIERRARSFQNVAEWDIWTWARGTPMERWLAPCHSISSSGTMLIQSRVEPIRAEERPTRLPAFLCDIKRENFGMLDGRIVCCDYGTVGSAIRTASRKLVPARWAS